MCSALAQGFYICMNFDQSFIIALTLQKRKLSLKRGISLSTLSTVGPTFERQGSLISEICLYANLWSTKSETQVKRLV